MDRRLCRPGLLLLGCVVELGEARVVLELPGGIRGILAAADVSARLARAIQEGEVKKCFY